MRPFFLSTPIYYVNDDPHIGHAYTTIVADVVARYRRLRGDPTFFLTGTDEHGVNIERTALRLGISPQEQADRVAAKCRELWQVFGIAYDDFIRTTEARHERGVVELIRRIEAAGDLYLAKHEGWYCASCEAFYTEKELVGERLCPIHERATEWRSEENVFFKLSRYQAPLLRWIDDNPDAIRPETRRNEVRSFVEQGLRDLSVSRSSLAWGIPFPGRPGQTVYVWLDALSNYITALGFGAAASDAASAGYEKFWGAADARRVHLIGKDILRFHTVYWPAFLLSAGLPLPTTVWVHGWWLRDGKKVSKTLGNVERFEHVLPQFGADPIRYFLLREMVFGQDGSFSDEAFVDRFNSDLANDLGNTVSRLVTLSRGAFEGRTPPISCNDNPVRTTALEALADYHAAMDECAFSRALEALWRILAEANQYIVSREPWKVIKTDGPTEGLSRVLWNGLEGVRLVATALLPFMPKVAAQVLEAIGVAATPATFDVLAWGGLATSVPLPEPRPIFPRIDKTKFFEGFEPPKVAAPREKEKRVSDPISVAPVATSVVEKASIGIDQFFETELRVGTIRTAERVPKSDKLIRMLIDLAEPELRQVVAGIGKRYEPSDLVGKQVVVVANLKPAKLMGVESNGMVLAGSLDGKPILLHPAEEVPPGTLVK